MTSNATSVLKKTPRVLKQVAQGEDTATASFWMASHRLILHRALSDKHSRKLIFIALTCFVFWHVFVLCWLYTSTEDKVEPVLLARYSHFETCECTHPGSTDPGKNGFTCSDDRMNAFCPRGITCSASKGELWNYGNFPCGHRVTCECTHPGNIEKNDFECSDRKYDDRCDSRKACLTPIGHVWPVDIPPCGSKEDSKILSSEGAYDPLSLASACSRTIAIVDPANAHRCKSYEDARLMVPDCSRRDTIVPRVLHSIGKKGIPFTLSMVIAANPSYSVSRHDDSSAEIYIRENCGEEVSKAFSCLLSPSFRADLFRFCALYADGGVYLDEDIIPMKPLNELISECSRATVGHDFPASGQPAKQMKILSAAPKSELMKCAMDNIVNSVRRKAIPDSPLALTGPLNLQDCYDRVSEDVAITYIDTRNAVWPYSGMRAGTDILAYEFPDSPKHFCHNSNCHDKRDYANLYALGHVYQEACELHRSPS
jgi:hypothetical protein